MKRAISIMITSVLFIGLLATCKEDKQPNVKKLSDNQITSFIFQKKDNANLNSDASGIIDQEAYTVSVTLPDSVFQSQDTTLTPTIILSAKASVIPLSGVAKNFSNPVTYMVKAEDGSEQAYTVTVVFQQTSALSGSFVGTSHPTSGEASATSTSLSLKNFQTDSGPQLNVYLSRVSGGKDVANDYVDLGPLPEALQDSQGDHTFTIPANTDLSKYKYVVIWCVDFNVDFGYALLQ